MAETGFEFFEYFLAEWGPCNEYLVCLLLDWSSGVGHDYGSISILVDSLEKVK